MDDTLKKLGTVRTQDEGRDAIHIAVLTFCAQSDILVHGRLYVEKDGSLCSVDNPEVLGILDPFLPVGTKILKGQWFYTYLKPGSISGLKHIWTHELLPEAPIQSVAEAEKEISDFVAGADCSLNYSGFIELFETGSSANFSIEGDSIYSGDEEVSAEIPSSVLDAVETILGRELDERPNYFRCAC